MIVNFERWLGIQPEHLAAQKGQQTLSVVAVTILLTSICVAVYWPVFFNRFQLKWDDWWVVMNDYTEGGFYAENIIAIFTEFYHGQYAPVNELYYLSLYTLFGYDPFWFHTASLLVHVCNVMLFFFLIKRLLQRSESFTRVSVFRISFISALLMAVHPFLVEAVAWMSASKCILWAFFYLLALHTYMSWYYRQRTGYYLLTIIFFVLSFGGKEQAVTLPVCLLLFDYVMKRNMRSAAVWLEKVPFFMLSAAFILVTFLSQYVNEEGILSGQPLHPWYQNIAFAAYSMTEYFIKSVLPLRLSYLYPFPNLPTESMPWHYIIYPLVVLFVTIGFRQYWKQRWIAFGMGFFLTQVTVISNIIPTSRYAIIADRYVYLAAAGVFFLIAWLTDQALQQRPRFKQAIITGITVYILALGMYANQRTRVWRDSDTLKKEIQETLKARSDYAEWKEKLELPD